MKFSWESLGDSWLKNQSKEKTPQVSRDKIISDADIKKTVSEVFSITTSKHLVEFKITGDDGDFIPTEETIKFVDAIVRMVQERTQPKG